MGYNLLVSYCAAWALTFSALSSLHAANWQEVENAASGQQLQAYTQLVNTFYDDENLALAALTYTQAITTHPTLNFKPANMVPLQIASVSALTGLSKEFLKANPDFLQFVIANGLAERKMHFPSDFYTHQPLLNFEGGTRLTWADIRGQIPVRADGKMIGLAYGPAGIVKDDTAAAAPVPDDINANNKQIVNAEQELAKIYAAYEASPHEPPEPAIMPMGPIHGSDNEKAPSPTPAPSPAPAPSPVPGIKESTMQSVKPQNLLFSFVGNDKCTIDESHFSQLMQGIRQGNVVATESGVYHKEESERPLNENETQISMVNIGEAVVCIAEHSDSSNTTQLDALRNAIPPVRDALEQVDTLEADNVRHKLDEVANSTNISEKSPIIPEGKPLITFSNNTSCDVDGENASVVAFGIANRSLFANQSGIYPVLAGQPAPTLEQLRDSEKWINHSLVCVANHSSTNLTDDQRNALAYAADVQSEKLLQNSSSSDEQAQAEQLNHVSTALVLSIPVDSVSKEYAKFIEVNKLHKPIQLFHHTAAPVGPEPTLLVEGAQLPWTAVKDFLGADYNRKMVDHVYTYRGLVKVEQDKLPVFGRTMEFPDRYMLQIVYYWKPAEYSWWNPMQYMEAFKQHVWLRLIDKNGEVYSAGFHPNNALDGLSDTAKNVLQARKGQVSSPDYFEFVSAGENLSITNIELSAPQFNQVKAEIERIRQQPMDYQVSNLSGWNCVGFLNQILEPLGFKTMREMGFSTPGVVKTWQDKVAGARAAMENDVLAKFGWDKKVDVRNLRYWMPLSAVGAENTAGQQEQADCQDGSSESDLCPVWKSLGAALAN